MKHEDIHERLALRLYGELESEEVRALDAHLEGCEDCRLFARELDQGLGRIVRAKTLASVDMPTDWVRRLRQATQSASMPQRTLSRISPPPISPWWTAAAGFAAGLALALSALRVTSDESTPKTGSNERSTYARYYGAATPPAATSGGQWSRLAAHRQR